MNNERAYRLGDLADMWATEGSLQLEDKTLSWSTLDGARKASDELRRLVSELYVLSDWRVAYYHYWSSYSGNLDVLTGLRLRWSDWEVVGVLAPHATVVRRLVHAHALTQSNSVLTTFSQANTRKDPRRDHLLRVLHAALVGLVNLPVRSYSHSHQTFMPILAGIARVDGRLVPEIALIKLQTPDLLLAPYTIEDINARGVCGHYHRCTAYACPTRALARGFCPWGGHPLSRRPTSSSPHQRLEERPTQDECPSGALTQESQEKPCSIKEYPHVQTPRTASRCSPGVRRS